MQLSSKYSWFPADKIKDIPHIMKNCRFYCGIVLMYISTKRGMLPNYYQGWSQADFVG